MTTDEVLCALDALAVQTGSLACLGCGHEHNCGIHGCAIIREAGKIIRWLSADNTALRYAINPAKVKRSQEQNFNGAVAYMRALIEEQRAQIEKAEAENAALREKVQQWISVEERRPEPGKRVLATDGVFVGEAYRTSADTWRRYDGMAMRDCIGSVVTHWMPLPPVPHNSSARKDKGNES